MTFFFFLFFFQAEDGIRDLYVTGVQTCALPISPRLAEPAGHVGPCLRSRGDFETRGRAFQCARPRRTQAYEAGWRLTVRVVAGSWFARLSRSEERRVGKECRSRGWRERGR